MSDTEHGAREQARERLVALIIREAWKFLQDQDCTCANEDDAICWYHISDDDKIARTAWSVSRIVEVEDAIDLLGHPRTTRT